MRKIVCALLICIFVMTGCTEQTNKNIVNINTDDKNFEKYKSSALEIPYDKNTLELNYIAEECIGILTGKNGEIQMYTVTRSVKEKYQRTAQKIIDSKEQLTPDMLECRIWKFTLDSEKKWNREEVCDKPIIDENEIAKQDAELVQFRVCHNRSGNLVVFLQYNLENAKGIKSYGIKTFKLIDEEWNSLGQYTYVEEKNEVQEPLNIHIDDENNLVVLRMDGSIVKYSYSLEKEIEKNTDYSDDVALNVFWNEYGTCKDNKKNQLITFDIEDFSEENVIGIPDISKSGDEILGVNSMDEVYYANSLAIYKENEKKNMLEKILSMDLVSGVNIEHMNYNYMGVSKEGDILIHMYDTLDDDAKEYIYLFSKIA